MTYDDRIADVQTAPVAPGREKVRAGHHQSSDADGRVFDIKHNRRYGDWDARRNGILYAREVTLTEVLEEIAGWAP